MDIQVKIIEGTISTDLYSKPTDIHAYLSWTSCHPHGTKKGIPYSQALRLRRICSTHTIFLKRLHQLQGYLRARGYKAKHINPAFQKVKSTPRSDTLRYKPRENNRRVTFPIRFHPNLKDLPGDVRNRYNNILLRSESNKNTFPEPPMMAYKRPQNLLEKISKARISNHIYKPPGFQNCSSTECQLHTSTNISSNFTSETTKENFNILQNLNCDSHNVIYLISCKKPNCGQQYVGETGRHLRERVLEHLRNIRTRKSCPVAAHFGSLFHKTEHFSIQAIEKCKIHTTFYRKTRERFWINRLKPAINQQHKTQFKSSNIIKRFQKKLLSKNSRPLKKRKKSHP